jgi:phenylalanyl-tRNA synthetase alpha chain
VPTIVSPILSPAQRARDLAVRDLTDPAAGPHALQLVVGAAVDALRAAWGPSVDVRLTRGPRVVPLADNYDRLRYPAEAVTRDARHTRYVDAGHVLRSHTSAMVPPALDRLAGEDRGPSGAPSGAPDDVLLACSGITYRRDAIDRLHTGTPHQLDLWRITRRPLGLADLGGMVRALLDALLPDRTWRWEARTHPYTRLGRQIDVRDGDRWVEVGECGMAHPELLAAAGLNGWSGLALGLGLDRLLMLRKGVPDIRLLRSQDPRVAGQMADLDPYRPVSDLPAVTRDLSIAVPASDRAEDLGDRVREALGGAADALEAVAILSETAWEDLPPVARDRLGMGAEHKNVLVRLTIRPVARTLTSADANRLGEAARAALHRGRVS